MSMRRIVCVCFFFYFQSENSWLRGLEFSIEERFINTFFTLRFWIDFKNQIPKGEKLVAANEF